MVFSTRSLRDTKLNYEIAARYNVEFKCHSVGWNVAVVDKHADLDLVIFWLLKSNKGRKDDCHWEVL